MPVPQPDPQEYNATQGKPRAVGMRGRGCSAMQPSGSHLVLLRFPWKAAPGRHQPLPAVPGPLASSRRELTPKLCPFGVTEDVTCDLMAALDTSASTSLRGHEDNF